MLVSIEKMLQKARKEKYGVIAPNVFNLETILAAVEAAYEERSPIIISYGETIQKYTDIFEFGEIAKMIANKYDIPIAVHLDHGFHFETCIKAIRAGFTSVMIDRSTETFEKNVAETKEIVKIAHSVGVSVEAELGHVSTGMEIIDESMLTDPQMAKEFVRLTGIDALAVAVGTAHGLYRGEPKIDFNRLEEINDNVDVPLVLHGGSFTGEDQLARAIKSGITKINVGTELDIESIKNLLSESDDYVTGWEFPERLRLGKEGFKKKIKHYIRIFGSQNKT